MNIQADREDYQSVLDLMGVTEAQIRAQSENKADQIALDGRYGVAILPSSIEGVGVHAAQDFAAGVVIMPARVGGMRTIAGRYVNHSKTPNAVMRQHESGDIYLVTLSPVQDGDELTTDYRIAAVMA